MGAKVENGREQDGVRWGIAAGLGLGLLVVGVGLGQLSLDRSPGEVASAHASEALAARAQGSEGDVASAETPASEVAPGPTRAEPVASPEPSRAPSPAVQAETQQDNAPKAAVVVEPVAPAGSLQRPGGVSVGRVAYLRCEGAETDDPRIPCPRDHGLEARAWRAIRALRDCEVGIGSGDARFTFEFGALTGTRFRERSGSEINIPSATQCIAPAAEGMQTEINARRLIVSFRFELTR